MTESKNSEILVQQNGDFYQTNTFCWVRLEFESCIIPLAFLTFSCDFSEADNLYPIGTGMK